MGNGRKISLRIKLGTTYIFESLFMCLICIVAIFKMIGLKQQVNRGISVENIQSGITTLIILTIIGVTIVTTVAVIMTEYIVRRLKKLESLAERLSVYNFSEDIEENEKNSNIWRNHRGKRACRVV